MPTEAKPQIAAALEGGRDSFGAPAINISWGGIMNKLNHTAIFAASAALALSPVSVAAQGPAMQLKPHPEGAEVAATAPDGPAVSLGLKVGDILPEVGGKPISPQALREYMQAKKEGDPVTFKVKRAGAVMDIAGKAPPPPPGA